MELLPVPDVPETRKDDDLVVLVSKRIGFRPDDVVCVASIVVSKAEGQFADLDDFLAGPRVYELAARLAELTDDERDP